MTQGTENAGFELFSADPCLVGTGPLVLDRRAAEHVAIDDRIASAAFTALDQAGKQISCAAYAGERVAVILDITSADRSLASLHLAPEYIIDDAQFRDVVNDPLVFRVRARHAPTGLRVLQKTLPVPDQLADVKLVVENAIALAAITAFWI